VLRARWNQIEIIDCQSHGALQWQLNNLTQTLSLFPFRRHGLRRCLI
jgi:hypothetical protein